jgi:hypothetical protein
VVGAFTLQNSSCLPHEIQEIACFLVGFIITLAFWVGVDAAHLLEKTRFVSINFGEDFFTVLTRRPMILLK